jgi:protein phosphatase
VDHTWVQERIDAGVLSPRSARNHPYASILTRVLGTEEAVVPDIAEIDVAPGDLFLLCTDGLTGMVPDAAIADILLADEPIATLADRLVAAAHAAGGEDNISLVLIRALPA